MFDTTPVAELTLAVANSAHQVSSHDKETEQKANRLLTGSPSNSFGSTLREVGKDYFNTYLKPKEPKA